LGGGQDIAKRQRQFLQQIASNTEKTDRNARNGGLVFAP
jgi:hypothetical protein